MGGAEEYIKRIAEGLVQRGHNIKVYTSDLEDHLRLKKLKVCKQEIINGVSVDRSHTIPLHLCHYSFMPALPIKVILKKIDIIHGHALMTFPSDAGALISRIKKIPFVFTPYFADLGPPSLMGWIYRQTLGRIVFDADTVVCVSEYEREIIYKNGFKTKHIEVVYPGVDIEEFQNCNYNIFDRYGLSNNKIILFVGRLEPIKGVDVLIRAMPIILKEIPEARLFIIGPDFGQKKNLEDIAEKLNIGDKIIFAGSLNRRELISAFLNADIFCLPSRFEAFGIVLVEAMAAKIPVVASDCSAIPYVIKDGLNGLLFEPGNHKQLSSKVLTLFLDNNLHESIVKNGYHEVCERYTWSKAIDKTEWIYRSLIN